MEMVEKKKQEKKSFVLFRAKSQVSLSKERHDNWKSGEAGFMYWFDIMPKAALIKTQKGSILS